LNVHNILRGIALREHGFFSSKLDYPSSETGRVVANASIAIKADDHPILLKIIVISPVSNYRPMQGTPIGRYV
jgi:hypothetical protein